ncbi:MAG: hypothetical protein IJ533_06690 [Prevotella sp.]|nr:hypothetical protein [Prevotella sp.]
MKKTYQNPTAKVVKIQPYLMQSASASILGETTKTSGNLSREGGSFWDEDEE